MFKSLRDRLKGVSKKIEEEMDFELEQQLEAELQASLNEDGPAAGSTEPAEPATPAATEPTPESAPEPAPEPAPRSSEPTAASEPTDPAEKQGAPVPESPAPRAGETATEAPEPTPAVPAPATTKDADPTAPGPADTGDDGPTAPEPSSTPEPSTEQEPSAAPEPAAAQPAAPVTKPTASAPEAKAAKPADQPRYGRKILSEEEIEARLQRELEAAVETQRDVESVVKESSGTVVARYSINEDVLEDILWELEVGLLESDVALPVIEAIKGSVKEQLLSMTVGGRDPQDVVEKVLRSAVRRVLNINPIDFDAFVKERLAAGKKPVVVMFVGVNGTGKTTSIGRIAYRLKQQGLSCVLAAGDTFRAGAIEQLSQHGDKLGVKVVKHTAGADPAAVAYDAVEHAKARHKDVVLLDTAGRMQTNTNLMDEMDKIRRVAKPDLVVFVGDSLAGNDAVEQARKFDEVVDIDAAILTKVDVDAKGGAALSVAYTINKPLMFVGVGQNYPDLRPFDAQWMVDRLFGDEEAVAA